MITVIKQIVEDYENSYHTEYTVTTDYKFEEDIIAQCLSQALKEGKDFLQKLVKGEKK